MFRYADFRLDASKITEFPDGSIKVVGLLTRPGVFDYGPGRKEYRSKEEVFREDSLATYAGATVTLDHPKGREVTAQTWKKEAIGHLGESIRQDGEHVAADIYVRDAAAVAMVRKGDVKYISCGYHTEYQPGPGMAPDGMRFDGIQRGIRLNHVALLPPGVKPRGGDNCVLRLDASENEIEKLNFEESMTPEQVEALKAQITALEGEVAKFRTDAAEVPTLRASVADLTAKLAVATAEVTPVRLDSLVEERVSVLALAKSAGLKTEAVSGKTNLEVKRAVIAARTPALATRVDSYSVETADAVLATYTDKPHASLNILGTDTKPTLPATEKPAVRTDAKDPNAIPTVAELYANSVKTSATRWQNSGDHPVKGN